MKDEEMAKEYRKSLKQRLIDNDEFERIEKFDENVEEAFLAGLKAGRPQWHKITDWKDNSQFPTDELKTYLVRLYQNHYVICDVDITEGYRQFYLSDNLDAIDPKDVIEWCEIPTFDKE